MNDTTDTLPVDYRKMYLREKAAHLKTQQALANALNPPMSETDRMRTLQSIERFLGEMPKTSGAVTCAGLYSEAFFKNVRSDKTFCVAVATLLKDYYKNDLSLIEPTYAMWEQVAAGLL
jgi:hypothetical protein